MYICTHKEMRIIPVHRDPKRKKWRAEEEETSLAEPPPQKKK
jgi:ribosomal protein L24E